MEFSSYQQWKIAFIHAFASTFNPQQTIVPSFFKLPEFTPCELESEIQKEDSELVHSLICSCLGNIFNRKSPIESFTRTLCDVVSEKMKSFDIDLEKNPLRSQKFYTLPVDLKLQILYSMVEWQLQDSHAVRAIIEMYIKKKENPVLLRPVGIDKSKNSYWQFGKSGYLWKESANKKDWERVCKDKIELQNFVEALSTSNRSEKSLSKYIIETLYPIADREKRRMNRLANIEARLAMVVDDTPIETRSQKRPRERVNYNYDDFLADSDSEDSQSSASSSSSSSSALHLQKRTRFSSRLNNEDPDDSITNQDSNENNNIDVENHTAEANKTITNHTKEKYEEDEEEYDDGDDEVDE